MASGNDIQHGARRQKLVADILLVLFEGKFAPGQRLRLEHLAEQFEVSVTPVREALVELAGIGVVELQPNRGAVLRSFGPRQVEEICQVRRILECEAVRSVCGRIAPFELELLESQFAELDTAKRNKRWSQKTREQDSQLHELIAERCGSERLAYEIGRYKILFRTLRDARHMRRSSRDNYAEMNENAEHLAIVRAMSAGDPEKAAAAMAYHIETSVQALIADLFDPQEIAADRRESFLTRQAVSS